MHRDRRHPGLPEADGLAGVQLPVLDGERQGFCGGLLVQRREERLHPALGVLGTADHQRPAAWRLVAILHEQERQAAEVVAVEMAEQHRIQHAHVPPGLLGRLQDAGPAVEQECRAGRFGDVGAVEPAARPERVAGAEHRHLHDLLRVGRRGRAVAVGARRPPAVPDAAPMPDLDPHRRVFTRSGLP